MIDITFLSNESMHTGLSKDIFWNTAYINIFVTLYNQYVHVQKFANKPQKQEGFLFFFRKKPLEAEKDYKTKKKN